MELSLGYIKAVKMFLPFQRNCQWQQLQKILFHCPIEKISGILKLQSSRLADWVASILKCLVQLIGFRYLPTVMSIDIEVIILMMNSHYLLTRVSRRRFEVIRISFPQY